MAGGIFLRPQSRRTGRKRRERRLAAALRLVLGCGGLLYAQAMGYIHPAFAGLLIAALSARMGYRLGLDG